MEPSPTDWISAIAALLGIPAVLFGIGRLFVKDKEKERQLKSLEQLAELQFQQVEELSKQTSEYKYHSVLMKESNELLTKQIEIQNQVFMHQTITEAQKIEIERNKRLSEIKPYLIFNGASSNPNGFVIRLLNKGNTAKSIELQEIDCSQVRLRLPKQKAELDKDATIEISGNADGSTNNLNSSQVYFDLFVTYTDVDNNQYKQQVSRKNHRFNIEDPILIDKQV